MRDYSDLIKRLISISLELGHAIDEFGEVLHFEADETDFGKVSGRLDYFILDLIGIPDDTTLEDTSDNAFCRDSALEILWGSPEYVNDPTPQEIYGELLECREWAREHGYEERINLGDDWREIYIKE